ncbi:MAG: ABC transporter ATP-binding protein [Lentisphaeria bacterium]|nr:ABC transporter ATP-binding protein [Lentisphaeria bacterium]
MMMSTGQNHSQDPARPDMAADTTARRNAAAETDTPACVEFANVSFSRGNTVILDNLTFDLKKGERLGLIGDIGAGKTTLLHIIVGLIKPTSGVIRVLGAPRTIEADFRAVRKRVGLVFQNADDQLFCPTVLEDVAFGPLNLGFSPGEAKSRAAATLARVGMAGFEDRVTYRLSGGEKRLIALATVLAMEPDILLLDEPFNGLDTQAAARVLNLLHTLSQSMMIVSHDQTRLPAVATRQLRLENGRVCQ